MPGQTSTKIVYWSGLKVPDAKKSVQEVLPMFPPLMNHVLHRMKTETNHTKKYNKLIEKYEKNLNDKEHKGAGTTWMKTRLMVANKIKTNPKWIDSLRPLINAFFVGTKAVGQCPYCTEKS